MQTILTGLVGAVVLIGLYIAGWFINNPWLWEMIK